MVWEIVEWSVLCGPPSSEWSRGLSYNENLGTLPMQRLTRDLRNETPQSTFFPKIPCWLCYVLKFKMWSNKTAFMIYPGEKNKLLEMNILKRNRSKILGYHFLKFRSKIWIWLFLIWIQNWLHSKPKWLTMRNVSMLNASFTKISIYIFLQCPYWKYYSICAHIYTSELKTKSNRLLNNILLLVKSGQMLIFHIEHATWT